MKMASNNIDEVLMHLLHGCSVRKISYSSKRRMLMRKHLLLDEDKTAFRYTPSVKGKNFKILISDIVDIKFGQSAEADMYYKKKPHHLFIVVYKDQMKNIQKVGFITKDPNEVKLWTLGLQYLMKLLDDLTKDPIVDEWLREAFSAVDVDKKNELGLKQIHHLLNSLNISNEVTDLKQKLRECFEGRKDENGTLTRIEFAKFFKLFSFNKNEVSGIVKEYGRNIHGKTCLNAESLQRFFKEVQQENFSLDECKKMISKYYEVEDTLSSKGLIRILISEGNDILDPIHKKVHQDMNRPLTDYFINSSHNTYLLKDQVVGVSSIQAYSNALKKGCKTIEMDCYDGENNEPLIYHGYTLTSKILFKDVINTILLDGFSLSDYPLILSFENHCSLEQQIVMARYLKQILGKKLFDDSLDLNRTILPSPQSLRGKILIKAKKYNGNEEKKTSENDDKIKNRKAASEKKVNISEEFSNLVNYAESVSFTSLDEGLASQKYYKNVSLGEKQLLELGKKNPVKFIEYTNKFLVRTYPKGSRIDSSNYNPIKGWMNGCQIVALNFQTQSEMMDINDGMFNLNGRCGYVLKPECLRNGNFNPLEVGNSGKGSPFKVIIKIISGHLLPKASKDDSIPDPYIKLNIHGIPKDEVLGKFTTKKVVKNGFNPQWGDEFQFYLYAPDLAHIRFALYDSDMGIDDFIGQYSIPFTGIRTGYRRVPLLNRSGNVIRNASLLIYIQTILTNK